MSSRDLLDRYLRQTSELGGPDLFLETLSRADAIRLAGSPVTSSAPDRGKHRERGRASKTKTAAPAAAGASGNAALDGLARKAAGCQLCLLHERRRSVVFGEGSPNAELVVVGEAPGQEEDRTGRPFVGRAGKLLDLLLLSAGFARDQVYICNVLKCRPPQNRNPQADEVELCTRNYLYRQLEIIAPAVILAVGRYAVQALLSSNDAIGRLRGRIHSWGGTPLVVSYHPAYLLRSPNMVRAAWSDLQLVRAGIDEQA